MNNAKTPLPEATEEALFELEDFLPYRLSRLTNTVSEGIARRYRQRYDIGVPEWRVIAVLGSCPGLSASEVAERTAMDKVTVSRAVRRLSDSGLLERRPDADDRRRQRLQLTSSRGREVLHHVVPLARDYERRLLKSLSDRERRVLETLLEKLQQSASALGKLQNPTVTRDQPNKKGRE